MKKHFNINKIISIAIVFVCFLIFSDKVKALDCFYSLPDVGTPKEGTTYPKKDNFQFHLSLNDDGTKTYEFYDKSDGLFYSRTDTNNVVKNTPYLLNTACNSCAIDQYAAEYAGMTFDTDNNGDPLTFVELDKKCPSEIYWYIRKETYSGLDTNKYWITPFSSASNPMYSYYTSKGKCSSAQADLMCKNTSLVSARGESGNSTNPTGTGDKVCSYVPYTKAQNVYYNDYITIDFSSDPITVSGSGNYSGSTFKATGFSASDIEGDCPSKVYTMRKDSAEYTLKLKRTDKDYEKWGRIKKAKMSDVSDSSSKSGSFCDTANGTKMLKYIRMIYTVLRYAVPALIVIFSTIDFLGVVMDGDQEHMAKAKKRFVWRLIIGLIIMLLPAVIEFMLKLAGIIDQSLVDVVCKII